MIKFADILPSFAALGWKKRRLNKGIFFSVYRVLQIFKAQFIGIEIHRIVCPFKVYLNLPFLSLD